MIVQRTELGANRRPKPSTVGTFAAEIKNKCDGAEDMPRTCKTRPCRQWTLDIGRSGRRAVGQLASSLRVKDGSRAFPSVGDTRRLRIVRSRGDAIETVRNGRRRDHLRTGPCNGRRGWERAAGGGRGRGTGASKGTTTANEKREEWHVYLEKHGYFYLSTERRRRLAIRGRMQEENRHETVAVWGTGRRRDGDGDGGGGGDGDGGGGGGGGGGAGPLGHHHHHVGDSRAEPR